MYVGSMQDYNYAHTNCFEITLEVSCCKFPDKGHLSHLWLENRDAIFAFIAQVTVHVSNMCNIPDNFVICSVLLLQCLLIILLFNMLLI
jgi:Zinc carboxypeptidase